MASLHTFIRQQFSRWVRKALGTPRSRLGRGTSAKLGMECLEAREVFSANPIVAENLLAGNPQAEWDIVGTGDPSIEGFATKMSVDQGQTISFKINDTSLAPYHIDIYRMGYYQGLGARKVTTIASSQSAATSQPTPLKDLTTGLIDAGNWSVSASWAVPTTAASGVYIARLVREDTGGASHILFVVRDDDGRSDLLVQTADTTWQAYNDWGGYSLYTAPTVGTSANPNNLTRAYKVSYDRPMSLRDTIGGNGTYNDFFHSEYPMIRWLEANGYNASYTTDLDSDQRGAEILEHQVFISMGHDEYWSGQQRANVEAARDAGVNLAFFSGNEVYWKTRWENSIDSSNETYRTLVSYKESKANAKIDPTAIWTGTWRDARFPTYDGNKPENALTGTIYMADRTNTDIGIALQVPATDASLRFWRNTAVANLTPGQVATIGDRVVGYETDEDLDNGFRPAGTITLSSTTFNTTSKVSVPWGTVVGPGTSTHQMTLYRAASGALVFGAGTVQWSWGLDGNHLDGNSTPDQSIRQATVNLFADMGVQAGSLQSGLVQSAISNDLTRPTSTISSPTGGSVNIGVPVTITGTATDSGGGVVGGVEVSTDGGFSWHKATGRGSWSYTWTPAATGPAIIRSRAADDSGNLEIPLAGMPLSVLVSTTSTTGLVAAYTFNAGSGTTLADSAGSNAGTISNATWSNGGMFGSNALSFNGTNAWATIPDSNSLDLTTGLTLEAWVKPTSVANWSSVLLKESTSGLSYGLYSSNNQQKAVGSVRINSDQSTSGTAALSLNAWSHLATTFDGSTLSLYINGVLASTQSVSGSIATTTGALRIGGNSVWGEYFSGLIDEVRVYNRALNQGEITADLSTMIGGAVEAIAPTVSLANVGGTVSGVVTLTANASDNVGVGGVEFLVDGVLVGFEDTVAPYTFAWNTATIVNGTYAISARAFDFAGNATTSPDIFLTVSNSAETVPPTVSLTGQLAGSIVSGTVTLSALAADNVGVVGVQFKANGVNIGAEVTAAPYQIAWSTSGLTSGSYSITAVARDLAGNTTTSPAASVTVDSTAPTVTATTPAANATSVSTDALPSATFSESIQPGSLSFVLKDPGGSVLPSTMSYNDVAKTATLTPSGALGTSVTYTVTVNARDLAGNLMASPTSWSFTTSNHISGATVWPETVTPTVASATNDSNPQELGMKFQSSLGGFISAIRFYKGSGNTGTHVGHLWTVGGTLLASATFANETATGWQEVVFSQPVAITAATTYVVSYYAPNGNYAYNSAYFTSAVVSYPLRALANGEVGGNGLYLSASGGGFPTQTYNSNNYWVDVVFNTNVSDTIAPTIAAQAPAANATAVPTTSAVSATFSEPVQSSTISLVLKDSSNNTVSATVAYNSVTYTATLTPASALSASTTYTATVSGVKDLAGNTIANSASWSFTTGIPAAGTSIWNSSVTPSITSANDPSAQELGMKFQSTANGFISGIRFYKGSGNTGTHVGHLWTVGGALLATATFTNETATGWQQVSFSQPVAITANTTYVISYYAPNGNYAYNSAYFTSAVVNSSLRALANGEVGGNGLYLSASGGGFPTQTYNSNNYWVDVIFSSTAADTSAPTIATQGPAAGATAVPIASTVSITFSELVQGNTISFVLKDASNNVVAATLAYSSSSGVAVLTPNGPLALNTTYTATVSGAVDLAGNAMPNAVSWSFTTPTPVTNASLWSNSTTPTNAAWNDSTAQELGVRFSSDAAGFITGLRFYKGAGNTGTHVGNLWALDGTLLATATFTNESATGWQQVAFAQPVAISANVYYVASYYAPVGHYALNSAYFANSAVANGPLHAPADGANGGNGLYRVGSGGGFPGNTYNSNNYWVDVVFDQNASDTTPPTIAAASPASGATGALPSSPIAITFSESVQMNTIVFTMKDPLNNSVAGNLSYNAATRVATFVPSTALLPFVRYTVTVSGVKDLMGNTIAASSTWSFTTQGIWLQTTYLDFQSGTRSGTVATDNNGGQLQLAGLIQDSFNGNILNTSNWTSKAYSGGGGVTVSNGILTVGAAVVYSAVSYTNTPLQGRISFGASPWQHFGMAVNVDSVSNNYWALFSTKGTTNRLNARVNSNGTTTDVDIGALPGGFHDYEIQPNGSGFAFYVDGVLMTTIAASFQTTVPLRAVLSNFVGTSGQLLQADSAGFVQYSTTQTGTFTSIVFDAGQSVTWDKMASTVTVPTGTTLAIAVKVGTRQTNGSIQWYLPVVGSDGLIRDQAGNLVLGQYLQYIVTMTTTSTTKTPVLDDISFTWM